MQRGRIRRIVLTLLIAAILGPVSLAVGGLIGWAGDSGHRPPLASLLRDTIVEETWTIPASALILLGFAATGLVLQRLLLPLRLRRFLRRALQTRPDVDAADKRLAYPVTVTVDGDGIAIGTAVADTRLRWVVLTRWEEDGERLFVLGDGMVGFCFCIASVPPEAVEQFRMILAARLGSLRETPPQTT